MTPAELLLYSGLLVWGFSEVENIQLKRTLLEMCRDISFACKEKGIEISRGGAVYA